jgi:Mor family transcriptional regulator
MSETDRDIIVLPDDAMPTIDELTGDLRILAEIVGVAKALEIGQRFHGTPIRIWGVVKFIRRHRNRCIRRDADYGDSGIKLARKYRLSDRQIWNILGSLEDDERQMGLF